ncbi:hypothetical protein HDU99_004427, partial [Rhizoclosmatium hyalinum]
SSANLGTVSTTSTSALTSPEQSRLPRSTSLASPGPSARSPSPAHLSSASSVGSTIHYRKLSGALLTPPSSSSTTTTDGVRKLSMANQPTCAPPPLVMRSVSHAVSQRRPSLAHSSFPSLARVLASYQLPALTAGFLSRGQANYFAVLQTSSAEIPALVFYSATRAQSLLGLIDATAQQGPAFGPHSLPKLMLENEILIEVEVASGACATSEEAIAEARRKSSTFQSTAPQAALRITRDSVAHVAEHGIFVLQVSGINDVAGHEEIWSLQLASGDSMMDWLKSIRELIASL